MPSSTRESLLQCVYELGTCSPATLIQLARVVAAGRHPDCLISATPCDECTAREAVCGILKVIAAR